MKKNSSNKYLKLALLCLACIAIYLIPYLRWTYYDTLLEAVKLTNAQFGVTMSAYGLSSMFGYLFGGVLADKFSARKLLSFAALSTGLLGLYFATFPGYIMQIIIYFLWGAIATLGMWVAMLKATRGLGGSDEQGRLFGLLEGGRGILNALIGFVVLAIFNRLGESIAGLTGIIISHSILNILTAVAIWFVFDDNVEADDGNKIKFSDVKKVLLMPEVWLIAGIVFANYSVFMGATYFTPYFTSVLGASATLAGAIAIIRTYVLQLAGPIGGVIADRLKSTTKIIVATFIIIIAMIVIDIFMPAQSSMIVPFFIVMVVLCIAMFAARGIYFATVDEVKIPMQITGTAIGVISFLGFTPDLFFSPIAGSILDKNPDPATAYRYIFILMLCFAAFGLLVSIVLSRFAAKKKKAEK